MRREHTCMCSTLLVESRPEFCKALGGYTITDTIVCIDDDRLLIVTFPDLHSHRNNLRLELASLQ